MAFLEGLFQNADHGRRRGGQSPGLLPTGIHAGVKPKTVFSEFNRVGFIHEPLYDVHTVTKKAQNFFKL